MIGEGATGGAVRISGERRARTEGEGVGIEEGAEIGVEIGTGVIWFGAVGGRKGFGAVRISTEMGCDGPAELDTLGREAL